MTMGSFANREPGAPAAAGQIPLCVPFLGGNEADYVQECIRTGWVSSVGPFVNRFERETADLLGVAHGIATTSGTAALHVALLVAGIERGDEVVLPSLTFIAPANAIRYLGAWPVFIDVDPTYWQLDVSATEAFLRDECHHVNGELRNRVTGRRVRGILPVHILGHPVDLDPLVALADEFGLTIVEDATEALGAFYRGRPVGGSGRLACFSFNGNKLLTTGGGGMVVCNDRATAARVRYLTTQAKDDPVAFVHGAVGFNYRLSNVLAAIGVAQLERLDFHVAEKRRIADRYGAALSTVHGVTLMAEAPWARSVYWMYTILLDARFDRNAVMKALDRDGVQTRPLWQALHASAAHRDAQRRACPVVDELVSRSLSLPCSVGLTLPNQDRVVEALRHCLQQCVAHARSRRIDP